MGRQVHGAEIVRHTGPQEPVALARARAEPPRRRRPRRRPHGPGGARLRRRLPAGRARRRGRPGDAALRLARARGGHRRRPAPRRSARRPRDRPRHRALLLRGRATRCSPRSRRSGPAIADGRMLDLKEVARRLLERAGVSVVEDAGVCTPLQPRRLLLAPRRRPRDRPPGRHRPREWPEWSSRFATSIRPGSPPTSPRCGRRSRPAPRSSSPASTSRCEEMGVPRRGRGRARRREPPRRPRGEARALGRALHVGLHRQRAEPQGPRHPAARPPDPFGPLRERPEAARQARRRRAPRS